MPKIVNEVVAATLDKMASLQAKNLHCFASTPEMVKKVPPASENCASTTVKKAVVDSEMTAKVFNCIDFLAVPNVEVDEHVHLKTEDGTQCTAKAAKKMWQQDCSKIVAAIDSLPNDSQKVLALQNVLAHPAICNVAKAAGVDPDYDVLKFSMEQLAELAKQILDEKKSARGCLKNGACAVLQSLFMAMAPPLEEGTSKGSQ